MKEKFDMWVDEIEVVADVIGCYAVCTVLRTKKKYYSFAEQFEFIARKSCVYKLEASDILPGYP